MNMFESVARQRSTPLPQVDPTRVSLAEISLGEIDRAVRETSADLQARQNEEGDWCFELEADATIPAEYIMLEHFIGEIDDSIEKKLAVYLRRPRPTMAAGRCSTAASSTSAPRSRPTSR